MTLPTPSFSPIMLRNESRATAVTISGTISGELITA